MDIERQMIKLGTSEENLKEFKSLNHLKQKELLMKIIRADSLDYLKGDSNFLTNLLNVLEYVERKEKPNYLEPCIISLNTKKPDKFAVKYNLAKNMASWMMDTLPKWRYEIPPHNSLNQTYQDGIKMKEKWNAGEIAV